MNLSTILREHEGILYLLWLPIRGTMVKVERVWYKDQTAKVYFWQYSHYCTTTYASIVIHLRSSGLAWLKSMDKKQSNRSGCKLGVKYTCIFSLIKSNLILNLTRRWTVSRNKTTIWFENRFIIKIYFKRSLLILN